MVDLTARTNEKLVRQQGLGETGVSPVCSKEQKSARATKALKKENTMDWLQFLQIVYVPTFSRFKYGSADNQTLCSAE